MNAENLANSSSRSMIRSFRSTWISVVNIWKSYFKTFQKLFTRPVLFLPAPKQRKFRKLVHQKEQAEKDAKIKPSRGIFLKSLILKIERSVNSKKNIEVLKQLKTHANASFRDGWLLQQDSTSPHTSRKRKQRFEDSQTEVLKWPPT